MVNYKNFKTIWKSRTQILEGFKNNLFKSEQIEEIAKERMAICNNCPDIDLEGSSCLVSGTQPCCSKCGCSLKLKIRSLSSSCGNEENPKWHSLLSMEEEDAIKDQLNYQEPNTNPDVNSIHSRDTQIRKPRRE